MSILNSEKKLLSNIEISLSSHLNNICDKLVSEYNNKYNPDAYICISGGRLLKYMTPHDKIFNNSYLEKTDPKSKRKLLKSYNTDAQLLIFNRKEKENRNSNNDFNNDNNNNNNNNEKDIYDIMEYYYDLINDYIDDIKNAFVDSFFIEILEGIYVLDFRLYYIENILNKYGLTLNLPQSQNIAKLFSLNSETAKSIIDTHLICSNNYLSNIDTPIIKLGLKIRTLTDSPTEYDLYFFECLLNLKNKNYTYLQDLPVSINFQKDIDIKHLAFEHNNTYNKIYLLNILSVIKELNKVIHIGSIKYKKYYADNFDKLPDGVINLANNLLNEPYYKKDIALFKLNYIRKLLENIDDNHPNSFLSLIFLENDNSINKKEPKLTDTANKYIDTQYLEINDTKIELMGENNIFNINSDILKSYIHNSKEFMEKKFKELTKTYIDDDRYNNMYSSLEAIYKDEQEHFNSQDILTKYNNSSVYLYTSASTKMNINVLKFQLSKDLNYVNIKYPYIDVTDNNYTISRFLYDIINLFSKLKPLREIITIRENENLYVYRGISNFSFDNIENIENVKNGDIFMCLTPSSTTTLFSKAYKFLSRKNSECCMLKIKLNPNGKYIVTGNKNRFTKYNENEIILSPNTQIKIVDKYFISSDNYRYNLMLEAEILEPDYNNLKGYFNPITYNINNTDILSIDKIFTNLILYDDSCQCDSSNNNSQNNNYIDISNNNEKINTTIKAKNKHKHKRTKKRTNRKKRKGNKLILNKQSSRRIRIPINNKRSNKRRNKMTIKGGKHAIKIINVPKNTLLHNKSIIQNSRNTSILKPVNSKYTTKVKVTKSNSDYYSNFKLDYTQSLQLLLEIKQYLNNNNNNSKKTKELQLINSIFKKFKKKQKLLINNIKSNKKYNQLLRKSLIQNIKSYTFIDMPFIENI